MSCPYDREIERKVALGIVDNGAKDLGGSFSLQFKI